MTPRPNAAPRRYEWRQTIRSGQIVSTSTATLTQDEVWQWAKEAAKNCREGSCPNNYSVKVECIS